MRIIPVPFENQHTDNLKRQNNGFIQNRMTLFDLYALDI